MPLQKSAGLEFLARVFLFVRLVSVLKVCQAGLKSRSEEESLKYPPVAVPEAGLIFAIVV